CWSSRIRFVVATMRRKKCLPPPPGQNSRTSAPAKDPRKFCEKFWLTKFCRNFRLQQEQVTELCLQEALTVTVQARPTVVAFSSRFNLSMSGHNSSNMALNSSNMSLIHWGASSLFMCSPPSCCHHRNAIALPVEASQTIPFLRRRSPCQR